MTTPRDIAGLLDDIKNRRLHHSYPYQLEDLVTAAATQLDSLLKERDALQARVKELEARQADDLAEFGLMEMRALRAEQERDELQLRFDKLTSLVGGIVIELGCAADSEAVFEAIAKLRQEREEAYGFIREVKKDSYLDDYENDFKPTSIAEKADDFLRRLASGPEKEKK